MITAKRAPKRGRYQRKRGTSPEGALEIICLLQNEDRAFAKRELQKALGLTPHNVDQGIAWASAGGLVIKHLMHGWPRYQGDRRAIERYMRRFRAPAEPAEDAPAPQAA